MWKKIGIAVALLIIGISVGTVGNALMTQQWPFKDQSQLATEPNIVKPDQLNLKTVNSRLSKNSCTGFYYTVRAGDTLSQLAEAFYGDAAQISLIIRANPSLARHPDILKIGAKPLIPNREANCS